MGELLAAFSFNCLFNVFFLLFIKLSHYVAIDLSLVYKIPPPPLFRLKLVYSYVIEVADPEYDLGFHDKAWHYLFGDISISTF